MNVLTALALLLATGQVTSSALPTQSQLQGGDTRPTLPLNQQLPSSLPDSPTGTFPAGSSPLGGGGTFPAPTAPSSSGPPTSGLPAGSPLSGSEFPGNAFSGNSQAGGARSTSGFNSQQDKTLAHLSPERTFGWDFDDSGELCYIVQISPEHAKQMLQELTISKDLIYANSTMPKELVGRIRKISVQIGSEILPRNPSLENIGSVARLDRNDVEAELDRIGPGSMARVEPDGQALPVQLPRSGPNFGPSQRRLSDSTTPAPGNQFLSDAGGNSSLPDYGNTYSNSSTPPPASQTNPNYDRDLMAALPTSTPGRGDRYPANTGQSNSLRGEFGGTSTYPDPPALSSGRGSTGFGQQPQTPSFGQGAGLAAAGDRMLDGRNNQPASTYNPNYQPPNYSDPNYANQGAGGAAGSYRNDMRDIRSQNEFTAANQPFTGSTQPNPDYERIASRQQTPTALPSTSPDPALANRSSLSPSDLQREIDAAAAEAREAGKKEAKEEVAAKTATIQNQNNLIGLFCVLSLVVNCYLFMLIRKLLTRYRTLLTNVRSQAA